MNTQPKIQHFSKKFLENMKMIGVVFIDVAFDAIFNLKVLEAVEREEPFDNKKSWSQKRFW